jgi:hypothetical protein
MCQAHGLTNPSQQILTLTELCLLFRQIEAYLQEQDVNKQLYLKTKVCLWQFYKKKQPCTSWLQLCQSVRFAGAQKS